MGEMQGSKTVSYFPCVKELTSYTGNGRGKRVLVVGSGCAGLGSAWHLNRAGWDVTMKEAHSRFGGHANTVKVDGVEVDTGFMVYNSLNYPNLIALFEELGVKGLDTEMGFSVSMDDGNFEWCGDTLSGLMATPSNVVNPAFYAVMRDILRFNKEALKALVLPKNHPTRSKTVKQFLDDHKFSKSFTNLYLVPMTAAIWSASTDGILGFPAITLFSFLNNHLLLQVTGHINWMTPAGRSKEYVDKIVKELGVRAQTDRPIKSVTRSTDPVTGADVITTVEDNGDVCTYDNIVFACHPDQALEILGNDATPLEKDVLGSFKYSPNDTYVHTDKSLMPKAKSAWTSWNYIGNSKAVGEEKPVFVTYWLNKLQKLNHPTDIFVSLNPSTPPAPDKILKKMVYTHPQYTQESVAAQKRVVDLQGNKGTYFCGAWMGYGFHEDGMRTGLEVAVAITGTPLPWVQRYGQHTMIPAPSMQLSNFQNLSMFAGVTGLVTKPILWALEKSCKFLLLHFLRKGFSKGRLTFVTNDGKRVEFVGKNVGPDEEEIVVRVFNSWFWVRVALEADLGMARSYIAGEWEVENTGPYSDGLAKVLTNLIDNMPNGKSRVKGGIDASKLATATVGTALNWLWYRLTMDNSIANSRSNIHAHYDLSNDLFKTFLDKDHMMYSSAIFKTRLVEAPTATIGGGLSKVSLEFVDTLEEAQTRKIDALLARLEPLGPENSLLDIGFGWGGVCIRAAEKYGCKVFGITLSVEQTELANEKVKAKGVGHLVTFELVDYRVFAARGKKFDRIVSCEMIEAVGHNHLPTFFRCVDKLLVTEGIFVMQAITMPDSRYPVYVKTADFLNTIIFPGGCCPSLSALLTAMANESTLHLEHVVNTNLHYAETLRQWRVRFNQAFPRVVELGFDDSFMRLWNLYLAYCEAGFKSQIINLQILTFSRPGNPNMIANRGSSFACPHEYQQKAISLTTDSNIKS